MTSEKSWILRIDIIFFQKALYIIPETCITINQLISKCIMIIFFGEEDFIENQQYDCDIVISFM